MTASTLTSPYPHQGTNKIYELLFGDNIDLYKAEKPEGYPWDVLLAPDPNPEALQKIVDDSELETRIQLLANHLLLASGTISHEKNLLGVIIEVGLPEGLDTLAAYLDGTARYINHTGKILVWENQTSESNEIIGELFTESRKVISKIGPWDQARRPAPGDGIVRLSFLVTDGLYFGEGPFSVLEKDPFSAPVVHAATNLLTYLTQQRS